MILIIKININYDESMFSGSSVSGALREDKVIVLTFYFGLISALSLPYLLASWLWPAQSLLQTLHRNNLVKRKRLIFKRKEVKKKCNL